MRVYYVGNKIDGCFYYRCLMPLRENRWNGEKIGLVMKPKSREVVAKEAMQSDVVVFQRPDEAPRVDAMKALKAMGKKVVFENDDTFHLDLETTNPWKWEKIEGKIKYIDEAVKVADLVTTTTEFLADEYRKLNPNVVVLKNCIDINDWSVPKRTKGDKVRIGMVGSVTANNEYKNIIPALKELNKDKGVQLVVLGMPALTKDTIEVAKLYKDEFDFWSGLEIEWHPYCEVWKYNELLNDLELDIMLIPRNDSYFNRCKSNCKFLEASMCEIPVIAQGFTDNKSPYQGKEDAENMVIVTDNSKWLEEITKLINNKEKRISMGKKAREYVIKNYNIKDNAIKWAEAYQTICEK